MTRILSDDLLMRVVKPGQYLGNEWGAVRKPFDSACVRLALAFPDLYELGMSNFGQRILYQIVNSKEGLMADRTYAPAEDMEALLREGNLPLWAWESRQPLKSFELIGFSLQYELTYTNVLNMLELAHIAPLARERHDVFPLVFGGGPSSVNPEPMAMFLDFVVVGDGEEALPALMEVVRDFKGEGLASRGAEAREELLYRLAKKVPGVYVPRFYRQGNGSGRATPVRDVPERVMRQVQPLTDANQPTGTLVPYLSLVHDRQVLEVRRGCDRGCRFCQPGYTFLPVRERSAPDLVRLSKEALDKSGHNEYSMLSLCVSDYTSLHEATRALNREHSSRRASMSFPSQRADRMNFDIAEELKVVRKSGITLAPEAGTERLRAVINKGLNHEQIISAIETAYQSGWTAVKLYFMLGLPTETDDDLRGIVGILKEATTRLKAIRRSDPDKYRKPIEFTCTLSNFVPKPFTPFQWFAQISPEETARRQRVLKDALKEAGLRNVTLNFTHPSISLIEAVISRGDRQVGEIIYEAWKLGCTFDAWDEKLKEGLWQKAAASQGTSLVDLACGEREVGSAQPWDVVHVGLADWWLVNEWKKALATKETAPCTENTCHACGVCTELSTVHQLANPKQEVMKKNPFVKELPEINDEKPHPSLFFPSHPQADHAKVNAQPHTKIRFEFKKTGDLRFISHLDLQHLFARAARRANIKVAFSEGFNPSPRLSLAVSLPLFQEGLAEIGEVDLAEPISSHEFLSRVNAQLPPEVSISRARIVETGAGKASLASQVAQALYRAFPCGSAKFVPAEIQSAIAAILTSPRLEVTSTEKDKTVSVRDIRSGVLSLKVADVSSSTLEFELSTGSTMHVKPQDLLGLVNPDINWRVSRVSLTASNGIPLFDLP